MVVPSLSLIDEGYLDLLKFKEISLCLLSSFHHPPTHQPLKAPDHYGFCIDSTGI